MSSWKRSDFAGRRNEDGLTMSGVDITQQPIGGIVFSVKHSGVSIVTKTSAEIMIEHRSKGGRGWSRSRLIQGKHPAVGDRLEMRHHQCRRHSLPTHIGTEQTNLFVAEGKKIIKITTHDAGGSGHAPHRRT